MVTEVKDYGVPRCIESGGESLIDISKASRNKGVRSEKSEITTHVHWSFSYRERSVVSKVEKYMIKKLKQVTNCEVVCSNLESCVCG